MDLNANSLSTNLLVTGLVLIMVFVMPWLDRKICAKLKLDLTGGVSENPAGPFLLRVRKLLLFFVFAVYIGVVAWLVFFSRSASEEYRVHVALFQDLQNAINIDFGILRELSLGEPFIQILKGEDIAQAYMNLMLFVPMGYLLPYVFDWFRARPKIRPFVASVLIALLIENLQLITRRGFYDLDDLIGNSLGALIGQYLFNAVAYVVTHPNWKEDLREYREWKKHARRSTLYPFTRRMGIPRTTILATDDAEILEFYVFKLGFRLINQNVSEEDGSTDVLLQMGRSQVEIRCDPQLDLKRQHLTIAARDLKRMRRRLEKSGIETSNEGLDPYTRQHRLQFTGPDDVLITIIQN
ncbi:MAG: VanZ family protein [Oscillospiraceae bacterium]|nr:VanZ family protein [Oscillospiraceae bacterium]